MGLIACPDCSQSISDAAPTCVHCGRPLDPQPAVALPGNDTSSTPPTVPLTAQLFFTPIGIRKLLVMTVFTFGLYQVHWFYRQWDYIRRVDKRRFNPALRAVFAGFFAYPLFRSIQIRSRALSKPVRWSAGILTLSWFVAVVSSYLLGLLGFVATVIPLVVVQRSINALNDVERCESGYSTANVVGIALGAVAWAFVGLGLLALYTKKLGPVR